MAGKPVIALDIDNTLGDYHGHFTKFAEQWTGRTMPGPETMVPGVPFYRHLGMSKVTYRQCKLAYRQGGMKRSMPVYPGVAKMVKDFRHAGGAVWLCTTRPYLRLDNVDPDTRHWLRRNHVQWDGILFGTYKYQDLVRNVDTKDVIAVLDDLPEQLQAAHLLGLPVYRREQPYNVGTPFAPVTTFDMQASWRVQMLQEIKEAKRAANMGNRR